MQIETGNPDFDGLYVCARPHCWHVLEWRDGRWEHPGGGCLPWPVGKDGSTGFAGWIGPLPAREGLPLRTTVVMKTVEQFVPEISMEYDL